MTSFLAYSLSIVPVDCLCRLSSSSIHLSSVLFIESTLCQMSFCPNKQSPSLPVIVSELSPCSVCYRCHRPCLERSLTEVVAVDAEHIGMRKNEATNPNPRPESAAVDGLLTL